MDGQSSGYWWALLHEAVDVYASETDGAETPNDQLVNWLAEWGREVRQRQTALLLLTAHKAKGREFDHVAILDGGWDQAGRNEDRDAPRRLYYVAMTRARKTLFLARFDSGNALLDALPKNSEWLWRSPVPLPEPDPALARDYRRLTLRDVDIGFVGRHPPQHGIHRAIAALAAGDALSWRQDKESWFIMDRRGFVVGRLARAFKPPASMKCIDARVVAILTRMKEDDASQYRDRILCDRWEIVLPELVFEPRST